MSYDTEHSDEPRSRPRPKAAGGGFSVLGLIALLVALLTAGYVLYRDPPWGRTSKYNFSTPENALRSEFKMRANGDIMAAIDLESKLDRKEEKKRLDTLKVDRTTEFKSKSTTYTVLFITYQEVDEEKGTDKERKEVRWFKKDEGSGYYRRTYVSTSEVRKTDEKLARDIDKWNGMPGFGGPGGPGPID